MTKSRFKAVATLVFTLLSMQMYAQYGMGKIEEIEAIQGRKLIVMVEEPREKMLKKIAKKASRGSVEDYKADLITFNENMKTVVEKFWPYNKTEIQYKTFDEIELLKKSGSKDYAVIACISAEPQATTQGYHYRDGLYWVKDIKEDFEERKDDMLTLVLVNTIEDWGKKPVVYVPIYDIFPTKASLVYGVKGIETYFTFRIKTKKNGANSFKERERLEDEMNARTPAIANKTLLIREEWLDAELNTSNFKAFYPYEYKICTREFMDEVAMNQDPKYAFGVVMPVVTAGPSGNYILYYQFVVDAADQQSMCIIKPSSGGQLLAGTVTGRGGKKNFTPKTVQKIIDKIKGKGKD